MAGSRSRCRCDSRRSQLLEAAIAIADADADDDRAWHRAWVRFKITLIRHGWTPPKQDAETKRPAEQEIE